MIQHLMIKIIGSVLNSLAAISAKTAGRIGFDVFCNPFSAKLKPYQLAFLNTAEKFTVNDDGVEVQCYKWGCGTEKILFIHGWASHSFRWKQYIEYFNQERYSLYAFDARAHGLSKGRRLNLIINASTIKNVITHIGNADAAICHSFGGFSLAYLLKHYPKTPVAKAVIMGAPGEAKQFFSFYKEKLQLSGKAIKAIISEFEKKLNSTPDYFSSPSFAMEIKIPCLIIHDKQDDEAPVQTAVALHKNWEGSILKLTDGLGHHLKSRELVAEVEQFIGGEKL